MKGNNLIIRKAVITEKSISDAQKGVYTFLVDKESNKYIVKHEVEKLFKVKVKGITSQNVKGKVKMVGRKRQKVKKPDYKKVRVTLTKGGKIDLFEVGQTT